MHVDEICSTCKYFKIIDDKKTCLKEMNLKDHDASKCGEYKIKGDSSIE